MVKNTGGIVEKAKQKTNPGGASLCGDTRCSLKA